MTPNKRVPVQGRREMDNGVVVIVEMRSFLGNEETTAMQTDISATKSPPWRFKNQSVWIRLRTLVQWIRRWFCTERGIITVGTIFAMCAVSIGIVSILYSLIAPLNTPQPVRVQRWKRTTTVRNDHIDKTYSYIPSKAETSLFNMALELDLDFELIPASRQKRTILWMIPVLIPMLVLSDVLGPSEKVPERQLPDFYTRQNQAKLPSGCTFYEYSEELMPGINRYRNLLQEYDSELKESMRRIELENVLSSQSGDLREIFREEGKGVCEALQILRTDGDQEHLLSYVVHRTNETEPKIGIEPLLPPLTDPDVCYRKQEGISLEWIPPVKRLPVHDFRGMCEGRLHIDSKTLFLEIGVEECPTHATRRLLDQYSRFGFQFDAIKTVCIHGQDESEYKDEKPHEYLLEKWQLKKYQSYQVSARKYPIEGPLPPMLSLSNLLQDYGPSDFVVLRINDNGKHLKGWGKKILFQDAWADNFSKVDVLYYEAPVTMREFAVAWKEAMTGSSMLEELERVKHLRERGVLAHAWGLESSFGQKLGWF